MARVRIPVPLRTHIGGAEAVDVEGSTVGEVLDSMFASYPALAEEIAVDGAWTEAKGPTLTYHYREVPEANVSWEGDGMMRRHASVDVSVAVAIDGGLITPIVRDADTKGLVEIAAEMRDLAEEDASEVEAGKYGLSFVNLDGNIGCLVNGAGLAMSTMDIIKYKGEEPANFLDVGGGANQEQVAAAFRIITADPRVKVILVNIFGGIMKCDVIARGIIAAVEETGLSVPLVVRLAGTNVELGKQILADSGLAIIPATTLDDAGEEAVKALRAQA